MPRRPHFVARRKFNVSRAIASAVAGQLGPGQSATDAAIDHGLHLLSLVRDSKRRRVGPRSHRYANSRVTKVVAPNLYRARKGALATKAMPHKKRTKSRGKYRKRFKSRGRHGKRKRRRPVPVGVQKSVLRRFTYVENIALDAPANTILVASRYPRKIFILQHAPDGFISWKARFREWAVVGAKITVKHLSGVGATTSDVWGVRLADAMTMEQFSGADTMLALERRVLGNVAYMARDPDKGYTQRTASWSATKWFGKGTDNDLIYANTGTDGTGADPSENPGFGAGSAKNKQPVFALWIGGIASNPGLRNFYVRIDYIVHFRKPAVVASAAAPT